MSAISATSILQARRTKPACGTGLPCHHAKGHPKEGLWNTRTRSISNKVFCLSFTRWRWSLSMHGSIIATNKAEPCQFNSREREGTTMALKKLRMICAGGDKLLAEWDTETVSPQRLRSEEHTSELQSH